MVGFLTKAVKVMLKSNKMIVIVSSLHRYRRPSELNVRMALDGLDKPVSAPSQLDVDTVDRFLEDLPCCQLV